MDDIMTDLCNYALKKKIAFELNGDLSPRTTAVADTETRKVVVNLNYYINRQIPLQFAHEIGHIVNGDHSMRALYFTPSRSGIELKANITALTMLVPYYTQDKSEEYIDVDDFMKAFAIPEHLRNIAEKVLMGDELD